MIHTPKATPRQQDYSISGNEETGVQSSKTEDISMAHDGENPINKPNSPSGADDMENLVKGTPMEDDY